MPVLRPRERKSPASCNLREGRGNLPEASLALGDSGEGALSSQREKERFALFALHPKARVKEVWECLHLLLWKQLIALLVRIELEGDKYDEAQVWAPAWKRLEKKILALKERVEQEIRRAESRGDPPRDVSGRSKVIEPLAKFTKEGKLEWDKDLIEKIKAWGKSASASAPRPRR